jgi:hypothetical protein
VRASAKEARKTCLWPPAPAVGRTAARIRRRDFGSPTVLASADANGADFQRSSTKDAQAASLANAAVRVAWLVLSRLNTARHPAARRITAVSSRGSDSMPLSGVDAGPAPAWAISWGASRVGYARRGTTLGVANGTKCNAKQVQLWRLATPPKVAKVHCLLYTKPQLPIQERCN